MPKPLDALSFADAVEDHAIVIISKPESCAPQFVELGGKALDQPPLFGEAIDTGGPNHIDTEFAGDIDGVTVIHQEAFSLEFPSASARASLSPECSPASRNPVVWESWRRCRS